jgi:hypothetical protein
MLVFTIALGIALADLLAVWIAIPMESSRGSTAGTANRVRRVRQPESTYGSNGAAYGRRLESLQDGFNSLARSTGTPENVTGLYQAAAQWDGMALMASLREE